MSLLNFSITYHTEWGQHLHIDCAVSGGARVRLDMATTDGERWHASLEVPVGTERVDYAYRVASDGDPSLRRERPFCRTVRPERRSRVLLADSWMERPLPDVLFCSAFTRCVYRPEGVERLSGPFGLRMCAVPPPKGYRWGVLGDTPSLGEWKPESVRMLARTGCYEWGLPLSSADFSGGAEYKYVLVEEADPRHVVWEAGGNRRLDPQALGKNEAALRSDDSPRLDLAPWRGAGVVVPVFSLRSRKSFGIGDFGDLLRLIDWAAATGLSAVQLLPINDTTATGTWRDSYPYSGISVFALHPLYVDPTEWKDTAAYARHAGAGEALNESAGLDYESVARVKTAFLRDLFAERGASVRRSRAYRDFLADNAKWLRPYARFCRLREANATADFRRWGRFADYDEAALASCAEADPAVRREEDYHCFVQFVLSRQMGRAHERARRLGIVLKGDIPIGICRDSVPAWVDRRLFRFDGQAGAPPDAFARHGQNWGFPTYDWDEMSRDGYAWWRERLRVMGRCFDAYRIDHVLGFFRIWEIPCDQVHGVLGRFRPALPLTEGEIAGAGFRLPPASLARPLLTRRHLEELSGEVGGSGLMRFFRPVADPSSRPRLADGEPWYTLRPEFGTQRRILAAVPCGRLRDILLDAAAEVLFLPDPVRVGAYHPRIAAQQTRLFSLLPEQDRMAFNRLYDDFFYVRHNAFWAAEALPKLRALTSGSAASEPENPARDAARFTSRADETTSGAGRATSHAGKASPIAVGNRELGDALLPCAEDLGMVPSSVKDVLAELGMLSLEIQRMPKRYGVRFDDVRQNPYLSVATIATHDMPPLRLWWREDGNRRQAFWQTVMGREGQAPAEASPEICEQVVAMHLESPSMLCLLALQDLLAIDANLRHPHPEAEQINVPADPDHYWRYRMHLTLEELAAATAFNEKLRGLVARSGR